MALQSTYTSLIYDISCDSIVVIRNQNKSMSQATRAYQRAVRLSAVKLRGWLTLQKDEECWSVAPSNTSEATRSMHLGGVI